MNRIYYFIHFDQSVLLLFYNRCYWNRTFLYYTYQINTMPFVDSILKYDTPLLLLLQYKTILQGLNLVIKLIKFEEDFNFKIISLLITIIGRCP